MSPVKADVPPIHPTETSVASPSRLPSVLKLSLSGPEPLVDRTTPIDTTSPAPPPAKRPRGRPRKVITPFGGELVDLDPKPEPEPEPAPTLPALREPGPAVPFVRFSTCFYLFGRYDEKSDLLWWSMPIQRNDDICACCSIPHSESNSSPLSHFLYCDGCTRSFHMGCLDPPIVDDADQPPPEKEWFCPSCSAERVSETLAALHFLRMRR